LNDDEYAIIRIDDEDENESDDDNDEEEDEEFSGDVSFNMTGKEDPNFSPDIDSIKKTAASQPVRRSSRSTKRPVQYIEAEVLSEEDGSDTELVAKDSDNETDKVIDPCPTKKAKVSKRAALVEDNESTSTNVKEHKSMKPKTAKKESKEKRKSKKKKKEEIGKHKPSSVINVDLTDDGPTAKPPLPCLPKDDVAKELPVPAASSAGSAVAECPAVPHVTLPPQSSRERTAHLGPRPTLVICPLSVLSNWQDQFDAHVHDGLLSVYTYYGSERTKDQNLLAEQDVVLTTYQTLSSEFSKGKSPLANTQWLRVVLDEGHVIRNPNAMMSKAVHALKSERRWVVTGTPIQNSMKDMFSIISFLKLEPFTDRQWWRRTMERPISEGDQGALRYGKIISVWRILRRGGCRNS